MRATALRYVALLTLASTLTPVQASSSATPVVKVTIHDYTFHPAEITVKPGARVVWVNQDESPHTATDAHGNFDSKALDTGDTFSVEFDHEGDFTYFCLLHPQMTGAVHVVRRE